MGFPGLKRRREDGVEPLLDTPARQGWLPEVPRWHPLCAVGHLKAGNGSRLHSLTPASVQLRFSPCSRDMRTRFQ